MAKTTTNAMNRVPPFMPILWQDWESDPDTSTMTDLQVGIFFKMLLRQWVVGSVPANVSDIIRECKLESGRNTVLRFLEAYPHLWTCDECGADFVRTDCGCSADTARTSDGQSTDAKRTQGVRRAYTRRTNGRFKNLRIDVNSGLELGTTKPNQTKPEPEPEPTPNGDEGKASVESKSESGSPAPQVKTSEPEPVVPPVEPELKAPAPAKIKPSAPAASEIDDMRKWNEDSFGVPAERLRNCIIYLLDYSKNNWLRDDPPTVASMKREAFVNMIDERTPPGWTPEKHKQKRKPEAITNSDAEKEALDLINSLSGQQ